MRPSNTPPPPSAVGDLRLDRNGGLDGWCRYVDQPTLRATVELLRDGEVVRALQAARLRPDQRDLGVGDGYCGFWFPWPGDIGPSRSRVVLEARERRLGTVVGRIVLGERDAVREQRMDAAAAALAGVADALRGLRPIPDWVSVTKALGDTLLHLAGRPSGRRGLGPPGLQATMREIEDLPAIDLGWRPRPRLSLIVLAAGDLKDLAARLRAAAHALRGLPSEILLLDAGTLPPAALLPTRLRGLVWVRTAPSARQGANWNAAAAVARGDILAFAAPRGLGPADLARAADLSPGALGLDAAHVPVETRPGRRLRHGLDCIVGRGDFVAMGGFDPDEEGEALWADLLAKAHALGLAIETWSSRQAAHLPEAHS